MNYDYKEEEEERQKNKKNDSNNDKTGCSDHNHLGVV